MWNSLNFVLESYFEYRDALALSRLFVVFFKHIVTCYWTKEKALILLYHSDTWIVSKLIESFCDLVISYYKISTIILIGRYFQVWYYINKKLFEVLPPPDLLKSFFQKLFTAFLFLDTTFFQ